MRVNAVVVCNLLAKLVSCTPHLSSCITKNTSKSTRLEPNNEFHDKLHCFTYRNATKLLKIFLDLLLKPTVKLQSLSWRCKKNVNLFIRYLEQAIDVWLIFSIISPQTA